MVRCVGAAVAIAMAGCASTPQAPATPPVEISAPLNLCTSANSPPNNIATHPGYVQYAVTVTDADGNPVSGLKQSDFIAYVPGRRLPIEYFDDQPGKAPQSIVVVVDESGSMVNKVVLRDTATFQKVRQEVGDAVEKMNTCDEVAVVAVGGHPANSATRDDLDQGIRVIQPLTTDHRLAMTRISEQIPWGQTPLYDGIARGLQLLETAHYPNRAMIVITDGLENTSESKKEQVVDRAKRDMVTIYVIGIGNKNAPPGEREVAIGPYIMSGFGDSNRLDTKTIEALSAQSGGQYFIVSELATDNGSTYVDAIGKVASAVGNGYSIGVTTPSTDTSEVQPIIIALANPGTRRLSTRKLESVPASAL
jgi:VWFA-related protein